MAPTTPDGFTINCPSCQRPLLVGPQMLGQAATCSNCGEHLLVPVAVSSQVEQPPPLSLDTSKKRRTDHQRTSTVGFAIIASLIIAAFVAIPAAGVALFRDPALKHDGTAADRVKGGRTQISKPGPAGASAPTASNGKQGEGATSTTDSLPPQPEVETGPTQTASASKATINTVDLVASIIDEVLVSPHLISPRRSLLGHADQLLEATIRYCEKRPPTATDAWAVCGIEPFDLRYDNENSLATCYFVGGGPRLYLGSTSKLIGGEFHRIALNRAEKTDPWALKKDGAIVELPSFREADQLLGAGGVVYFGEAMTTQLEVTFFATPEEYQSLNKGFRGLTADVAFSNLSAYESQRACFYRSDAFERLKHDCHEIENLNITGLFDEGNAPSCYVVTNAPPKMVAHAKLMGFRLVREDGSLVLDCVDSNECREVAYPARPAEHPRSKERGSEPRSTQPAGSSPEPKTVKSVAGNLKNTKHTKQAVCEQGVGTSFTETGEGQLIGVEVTTARFGRRFQGTAIGAIRPLFLAENKVNEGRWHGTKHGEVQQLIAKPGYSLTRLEIATGGRVMGLNLHFANADGATDSSGWIGQRTDNVTELRIEDGACVGLFGSSKTEVSGEWPTTIRSLGLITADRNRE